MSQSIYNKTFKLRAGETVSILLGERIPISRAHLSFILKSMAPKTIILVVLIDGQPETSITKHVRVKAVSSEFDFNTPENRQVPVLSVFNRLDLSVPEDTEFDLMVTVDS